MWPQACGGVEGFLLRPRAGVSQRAEANKTRMGVRTGLRFAPDALVSLALTLTSCGAQGRDSLAHALTATPDPLRILDDVRKELIPTEGSSTDYGPSFTLEGYEVLRQWNVVLRPAAVWADDYVRLDIQLPCCEAIHPYEDESQNCGCGHHQALYGLGKRLLQSGARVNEVQAEIGRWRAYLFPRETLQAEMERRALSDPAIRQALDELRQQGVC